MIVVVGSHKLTVAMRILSRRLEQWDDKWINIVEPSERDKVRYGVNVVAQCLGELLKETRH